MSSNTNSIELVISFPVTPLAHLSQYLNGNQFLQKIAKGISRLNGPLKGIRVAELTSVVLGPLACQMLGDLGADVIKIEPIAGDSNRNLGPFTKTDSMRSMFLGCNRNKRSVSLDLKSAAGHAAAIEIIKSCDVLVHNFRPAAIKRLNLGYEDIKQVNEKIVYCASYGYSKKGPYGDRGALDDAIQAASGMAILQSTIGGEPRYFPTVVADKTTATMVVQAVLAALFHRERSGEGQQVEVPMFESMVSFIMTEHLWGQAFEPSLDSAGYPRVLAKHRRPYPTSDGYYLALLPYWDNHWETFCRLAEQPDLATDERFCTMSQRLKNIDESYRITGEIIATRTLKQWMDLLQDTRVPMMVVNTLDDLISNEQLVESGFWHIAEHPSEGQLRFTNPPINFSKTPAKIDKLPPHLGEHSVEVLREVGIADKKIEVMLAEGSLKSPL